MYFSDMYRNQRMPKELMDNEMLWGEGLSGALYWNDFLNLAKDCGFRDPRLVNHNDVTIANRALEAMVGDQMKFYSATYRLWKLPSLESDWYAVT